MVKLLAPTEKYQPDAEHTYGFDPHYQTDQQITASLVGFTALLLPFFFIGYWLIRGDCFRDSISHFYYSPFPGTFLVAALAFIGTFLFAYRGENWLENLYAWIAGIGAIGVAIFPTQGTGCEAGKTLLARAFVHFRRGEDDSALLLVRPDAWACPDGQACQVANPVLLPGSEIDQMFSLFPATGVVHYLSALLLFSFLFWYCVRVFPRVVERRHREHRTDATDRLNRTKRTRNAIYYLSGAVIAIASLAMLAHYVFDFEGWESRNLTFWAEAAALWAFGLSWMVKGRFFGRYLKDDTV